MFAKETALAVSFGGNHSKPTQHSRKEMIDSILAGDSGGTAEHKAAH